MKILALDPSSNCIGYAVMENCDSFLETGLVIPQKKTAEAVDRIQDMQSTLCGIINRAKPGRIIIEHTSGKTAGRLKKNVQGLAIYGFAIGAIWQLCKLLRPTILILENEWTKGVPKPVRIQAIKYIYPDYDPTPDPGGDAADALGLGRYYLIKQERSKL